MNKRMQEAPIRGVSLGMYQAHALGAPLAAIAIFALSPHFWWLGVIFLAGAVMSWYAWWDQFRLAWSPVPPTARRPGDPPLESDAGSAG